MSDYLESLKISLPKVIAISNLTNSFERIGLLAYRDYTEANRKVNGLLEWSGWYDPNGTSDNQDDVVSAAGLMQKAATLEPIGGGDYPEATKTGLARAYSLMREEATTIILLYTDAPPHCWMVAEKDRGSNYFAEQNALKKKNAYSGFGQAFMDWVAACKQLHQGPRKAHVFCFLDEGLGGSIQNAGYYNYLSTLSRGACFYMTDAKPHSIAQVTVDVLLAWMGAGKSGADKVNLPAQLVRYKSGDDIKKIKDEKDANANSYFWAGNPSRHLATSAQAFETGKSVKQMEANLAQVGVNSEALKKYLPKRKTPVSDFAQRYAKDERFKGVVVEQLRSIIQSDVTSMSLNPVFGTLWRAVCNDRDNPARDELITAFGYYVDKIADADEKARMKAWLEESYDYTAEVLGVLDSMPENQRFPCVFLDPTIEFRKAKAKGEKDGDEDEEDRQITAFRRDELLEIGRSCDGRILRRLGKVLTRLTYVESAAELPDHIAATTDAEIPKIPIALASKEHGWKFWKILLHTVLPGTMLSARPAVVLAALAIRMGLKPLHEAATAAMLFWRDKWNNIEIPETWNSSCLGLLLDADAAYIRQMKDSNEALDDGADGLLLSSDRKLFSRLVAYKHAEANLLTTLTADIGWTPQKTRMPVGTVVKCRGCAYPRSVTIMAEHAGGKCGLCVANDWKDAEQKARGISAHVTKEDNEASDATWVECSIRTCRAQYVCYNPEDLNVRPKCHYCRLQGSLPHEQRSADPAPTLECAKCLSKVIWPKELRQLASTPFHCAACQNSRKTIVPVETSADAISKENGRSWLLQNKNDVLKQPFQRTLFHTISTVGAESFLANVRILPALDPEPVLTLGGKRIRNQAALKAQLQSWIDRRTAEKTACSLCFSDFPNARLLPACRRRGCHQRICEACLQGWYGLNSPGTVINTAALFCPFCRRPPAARTLAAYGMGIHAVGNLKRAVEERGRWIYAWCYECSRAEELMERECARGAPEPVSQWTCEGCSMSALQRARAAEEEARRAAELAAEEERAAAERRLQQARRLRRELEFPVKECPKCKTPTQKLTGCDHITCTIRNCGAHWCWACGKKFDSGLIYTHMAEKHGGYYRGGMGVEDGSGSEDDYWD